MAVLKTEHGTAFKSGDVLELFVFFRVHQFKYQNGGRANVSDSKWVGEHVI